MTLVFNYDTVVSSGLTHISEGFKKTAGYKPEEGEDDVKSACPLYPGLHTCYNG